MNNWSTDRSGTYDSDLFYTNIGRESETMRLRLSSAVAARIRAIVEQRRYERIKTMADFVRDAVFHRLYYLGNNSVSNDTATADVLSRLRQAQETANEEADAAEVLRTLEAIQRMVTALANVGEFDRAREKIRQVYEDAESMADSYWRERYLRELRIRFGGILNEPS